MADFVVGRSEGVSYPNSNLTYGQFKKDNDLPKIKEVKLYSSEVDEFVEFMKTFDSYIGNEYRSHDVNIDGYHIYLYEGQLGGGGIMHITKC